MGSQHECRRWDLIPQHATGIDSFHEMRQRQANENPSTISPSSVVTIGILDTGVDPAIFHENPDVTLVDSIDCTSSGDVDMTEEVAVQKVSNTSDSDFYYEVVGQTGRTLKLSKDWNIKPFPSSELASPEIDGKGSNLAVRIGMKRGYDMFPKSLTELCRKNSVRRKQRDLDVYIASLHQNLAEWQNEHSKSGDSLSPASIAQRDDWLAQLEILQKFVNDSDDPGPVYDCVVFWDGSTFRSVIDVKELGDLRSLKPITSYGKEHEFGTFPIFTDDNKLHSLNFVVQLYNHGKLLSIVTDCSPHGTHVAQIAATTAVSGSCFGWSSLKVRLVSFKIGDPRLGTMETGTALIRAIQMACSVKYHCDIINISYGEAVVHASSGKRFVKLIDDCVWKCNTVIVCAAGNHGPALTTVNAPGGTLSSCISVGAVVTPMMKETLYSMLPLTLSSPDDVPLLESASGGDFIDKNFNRIRTDNFDTTYTWSSVGPTADGDWGVTLSAPGGAISSVPEWCLSKSQLMNGTSMACPHATGCIALLIGACKAEGIPVSAVRIRRALENTSRPLPNRSQLEQGHGLIQVDKAWEYIQMNRDDVTEYIGFEVEIVNPIFGDGLSPRGIYIRHADSCTTEQLFSVKVIPKFLEDDATLRTKRMLTLQLNISLETHCSWVSTAGQVVLTNSGSCFDVEVDPSSLCPGLHCASIKGFYVYESNRKPIFSVPVTVTKPILPVRNTIPFGELMFEPAEIKRIFVVPPYGSTIMDVMLRDTRESDKSVTSRAVALHTVQLLPHAAYRHNERNRRLSLAPEQTHVSSITVEPNVICEIVVARYWSTRQSTTIDVTVRFRGIRPVPTIVNMIAGSGGSIVRAYNELANELVSPSGKLTVWQVPLRPLGDSSVTPVRDDRDLLSESSDKLSYQLILTYKFEQEEKGSFIPRVPALQGVLYESAYESQCMQLFDGDKKFIGMSDAFPSSITAAKGPVIIRLQIRHKDPCQLRKLKSLVVWIERQLTEEISLSTYSTRESMLLGTDAFKKRTINKGLSMSVFLSEPEHCKLPSSIDVGHRLLGVVSYVAANARVDGFPIIYYVGPNPAKTAEAKVSEATEKPSLTEQLANAIRDIKIEYLGKVAEGEDEGAFQKLWQDLISEYPDHLYLYVARLKYLDGHPKRRERLKDVVLAAKDVVGRISEESLAQGLGRNVDPRNVNSVEDHRSLAEKRDFLVDALVRLLLALLDSTASSFDVDSTISFDITLRQLKSWVDFESSPKLSTLRIENEIRAGRYGLALKQINKILEEVGTMKDCVIRPMTRSELIAKRCFVFEKLGLDVLLDNDCRMQAICYPKVYIPF